MPTAIPSLLKTSSFRVRVYSISSNRRKQHHRSWILLILLVLSSLYTPASSSAAKISYHQHCSSVVIESTSNGLELDPLGFLHLNGAHFTGGDRILGQNPRSSLSFSKSVNFRAQNIYKTETNGILKIQGTLNFRGGSMNSLSGNSTIAGLGRYRRIHPRPPKIYHQRGKISFQLQGFWSESSGKLCMVGTGFGYLKEGKFLDLSVVFKLNYPKMSNISTTLVTGTVESLDATDSFNYFDPISVVGFSQKIYNYTLISQAENSCSGLDEGEKSLGLESDRNACSLLLRWASGGFRLDYGADCTARNCSPFDRNPKFLPKFMNVGGIQCSDNGKLRLYLGFTNSSNYLYNVPLDPERSLVGEGIWHGEKNRLCVVGCRLANFTDSLANTSVGDCTIRLTLSFPAVLSIRVRSTAVGQIWSNTNGSESAYFERIALRSLDNRMMSVPGLEYEYTELGSVSKLCGKKAAKSLGKRYPDGHSFEDMRFDMSLKDTKGKIAWGYLTPLSVGDELYENSYSTSVASTHNKSTVAVPFLNHSLLNVSYSARFTISTEYNWGGLSSALTSSAVPIQIDISAEGVYDSETGTLCMVGCRYLDWKSKKSTADSMDCEILINVEFSPLNPEARKHLKGTIRSTREKTHPFYFEPLEMSANVLYIKQAKESIRRMDLEITLVLFSLTLACVFIGLQLFHVKKHPDVLPCISIVMLIVLTLGHMIPLVLNFEAFFLGNRNRQNVLLWSGGWLEVNEVIVRLVTMVALLLQFHLLQLAWSARLAEERKGLWAAEKRALRLCFLLYLIGALIALFVHWKMYEAPSPKVRFIADSRHSIWEDMRSYAGLVLDGFLLPQVLFNIFWNSKDKTLAPSFYIGTTVVRSLPHAYDAYRAHKYTPHFKTSYIYANPGGDLYSAAWDVIIPCGGLLFSIAVYLQQRFGGGCILRQRFRQSVEYEKVPAVIG